MSDAPLKEPHNWRERLAGYGSGIIVAGRTCAAAPIGRPCKRPAFMSVTIDGYGEDVPVCEVHGELLVDIVETLEAIKAGKGTP